MTAPLPEPHTLDLCGVCGASWDCEHKPDRRLFGPSAPDPFGPPVARVVGSAPPDEPPRGPLPPARELQARILALVLETGGLMRSEIEKRLGFKRQHFESSRNCRHVRAFNAAFLALRKRRATYEPSYGGKGEFLGGRGYPDLAVYELTDRLNAIDGVCTVQSCAGHRQLAPSDDAEERVWNGQVWLRLSEVMMEWFLRSVYTLSWTPEIERVQVIFRRWGGDVVDIVFQGMNKGSVQLARSSDLIVWFFEGLRQVANVVKTSSISIRPGDEDGPPYPEW